MNRTAICALVLAVLLAACGGISSRSTDTSSTTTARLLEVAGPNPSASAKMVCEQEAAGDIASTIGIDATRVSTPTWKVGPHVFACNYVYPDAATLTLSVKEMSSPAETTAYYDSEATRLGKLKTFDIADGAFRTTNGSLVVRKDYKVLLIDVSRLPSRFGRPLDDRATVAVNIATVIMDCWSGE